MMAVQSSNKPAAGLSELRRRVKTAANPAVSPQVAPQVAPQQEAAARQLLSLLGLGAATGVGVRSLRGMYDLLQRPTIGVSPSVNLPHTISVAGRPQHANVDEQERLPRLPMRKLAGAPSAPPAPAASPAWLTSLKGAFNTVGTRLRGAADTAGNAVGQAVRDLPKTVAPYLPESNSTSPLMNDWGIPAMGAAVAGGAYGGHSLVDWLLRKQRESAGQQDLADAQDDYQQALAEQYRSAMMSKRAGDDMGIDALADRYLPRSKQAAPASIPGRLGLPYVDDMYSKILSPDTWAAGNGIANAIMAATALGAGKVTYDWAKGQNSDELMQKALKRRQLMRQQLSPPPIVALPEQGGYGAA